MSKPKRRIVKASVLLFAYCLASAQGALGQVPVTSATTAELYFNLLSQKQLFSFGENVVVTLELYSRSEQPIFVSRMQNNDFVSFKVIGPDGKEVPWHGESRSGTKEYLPSDFTVLEQYRLVSANRIISMKGGAGFAFDKPGQYSLTAEFSMGPPENVASIAGGAKPAIGTFHSSKLAFCIEACLLEPLDVRKNAPQSAIETVRQFYTSVTRYRPLGIPDGRTRKTIRPLLSKRLAQQLESLEACDKDYYRRYGEILRANTFKPGTPWLESGLFTGPDGAATPFRFRILSSRSVGENRVDVELEFTHRQTYSRDLGLPPSYEHYQGDVTVIVENSRWVIDDYVAMYGNDALRRLSAGFPECKGGQWVGENPY